MTDDGLNKFAEMIRTIFEANNANRRKDAEFIGRGLEEIAKAMTRLAEALKRD
jgi:hypothetical protein